MSIVRIRWLGNAQSYNIQTPLPPSQCELFITCIPRVCVCAFGFSHTQTLNLSLVQSVRSPRVHSSILRFVQYFISEKYAEDERPHFRSRYEGILKSDFIWDEIDSNGK